MSEDNIFQKIIDKQIPAEIVYEDEFCLAFKDIHPVSPRHILVIPKKSIPSLREVRKEDEALLGRMVVVCSEIASEMGLDDDGYRVVINAGKHGGQTVYHLHMHVMGGRPFTWPPG